MSATGLSVISLSLLLAGIAIFILYINDLFINLPRGGLISFADDTRQLIKQSYGLR